MRTATLLLVIAVLSCTLGLAEDPDRAATQDPAALTTPDPATQTTPTVLPVNETAPGRYVVGETMTFAVQPTGSKWHVIKSTPCEEDSDTHILATTGSREMAEQIADLLAGFKGRWGSNDLPTDLDTDEFELAPGQWAYLDEGTSRIYVARKCERGQHHCRWLLADCGGSEQAKLVMFMLKNELAWRNADLVAKRKAENARLIEKGVIVPSGTASSAPDTAPAAAPAPAPAGKVEPPAEGGTAEQSMLGPLDPAKVIETAQRNLPATIILAVSTLAALGMYYFSPRKRRRDLPDITLD